MGRIALVGVVCLMLLLTGCPAKQGIEIKCSLILDQNSEWYKGMARWKELVEKRTKGRVRLRIYPRASLAMGNQRTERDYLRQGVVDVALQSNLLLYDLDHRWGVFSLPWLFPNHAIANKVCDGPAGQEMLKSLEAKGIIGLAYGVNGFRQLTNNQRPIRELRDMKGLKVRVPSAMYVQIFRAFGSDPSQMSFGELFTALRQGTMHAQENPLSVIMSARLFEVQNQLTLWNYSYDCLVLCMNATSFRRLPKDVQRILVESAKEAMEYERRLVMEADRRLVKELRDKGMRVTTLTPRALVGFKAATAKLDGYFTKDFGAELVRRFRAEAAKAAAAGVR